MGKNKAIDWGIFILLSVIWGSSFILMKVGQQHLNGYQIGATRILSAGLVFAPFALFHLSKVPAQKIPLIILSGLLGNLFPAFLFALAIEKIDSSLEGILNSLTPLFVIVIGALFFKATVPQKKVVGVLVGLIGLVVLSLSSGFNGSNIYYALLILLATFFYGLNVNVVSHYLRDVEPIKMATVSLFFMAIPAAVIVWQQHVFNIAKYDNAARLSIAASALLGIVGSAMATALFYILIKRAGGLFASLVTYGIPVVAIFWGLLAHENVTMLQVGCLGLILGGVYIANRA